MVDRSPLLIVSGEQALLRRRFVTSFVNAQRAAGWDIVDVDGTVPGAVHDAIQGDMFSTTETLALVSSPEKVNLDLLMGHHQATKYRTTLLLNVDGEVDSRTKFGKAVKASWSSVHKNFPLAPEWKAVEAAASFVQEEARREGVVISAGLAVALVQRSGTDFGLLAFEVAKIVILTKLDGVATVEPQHVKGGMAPIAEASILPISEALGSKDVKKLVKALTAVRRTSKSDPTMRVSRLLASSVLKWMQAAQLDALPSKVAAQELGVHPWVFENKVLPAARRWGKRGTMALICDLALSERAVLNGHFDPWVVLSSRLLAACRLGG